MIGDIVGRAGRKIVRELLPQIIKEHKVDLVIANGENAAGGNGITQAIAEELYSYGVDILTMGNHVWDKKEIFDFIDYDDRILRPANYPLGTPGKGFLIFSAAEGFKVGVINLSGRVFLNSLDCPFRLANQLIQEIREATPNIIVDFHAEATSEKVAFGWYLNGRVSAVLGTHTHVQTADERVLPGGTAYITDVGMTGPRDSVLGVKIDQVITKFTTQLPVHFEAARGMAQFNGVLVDLEPLTGKAIDIRRLQMILES